MTRLLRIIGVVLIVSGVLVILSWLIEPLRQVVPLLIDWFGTLPAAMQIGLGLAAVGFLILFGSIVWERLEDKKQEENLRED